MQERTRTAACACGAVRVSVQGKPIVVNACACTGCQRRSGSAFTYGAFYRDSSVTVLGTLRTFRNTGDLGRWRDSSFCPTCGITLLSRLETFPNATGISVGALADSGFSAPKAFYWAKRKHAWYGIDAAVQDMLEQ